ncbi:MAG: hypothetical protein IPF99_07205 [Deltaproteobacteria bacterium]|nr:hypothetical protein [Deltaproteobacteria bacterium]
MAATARDSGVPCGRSTSERARARSACVWAIDGAAPHTPKASAGRTRIRSAARMGVASGGAVSTGGAAGAGVTVGGGVGASTAGAALGRPDGRATAAAGGDVGATGSAGPWAAAAGAGSGSVGDGGKSISMAAGPWAGARPAGGGVVRVAVSATSPTPRCMSTEARRLRRRGLTSIGGR